MGQVSTSDWLAYFERNRTRRMAIPWEKGIHVDDHLRLPLIRSLQRFQVGEEGDGAHLRRGAAGTGDATYTAAIALFVAEEQVHARLLARLVQGMGGKLLRWHWSDACFVFLRRPLGLHVELMVLLVAEMIAKRYYRALYEGTRDEVLRAAFAQILRDEVGHVAFHCATLQHTFARLPPLSKLGMRVAWWLFYRAVCLVVLVDHASVLRATGVRPSVFWRDCGLIFHQSATQIFVREPIPLSDVSG